MADSEHDPFLDDEVNAFEDPSVQSAARGNSYDHYSGTIAAPPAAALGNGSGKNLKEQKELEARLRDLEQREQAVVQREKELKALETKIAGTEGIPNWPSECYPLLRHNIDEDIPRVLQKTVRRVYYICIVTWICLFYNCLVIAVSWWTKDTPHNATDALWATVYLVAGVPGAWKLWYYQLYQATKTDSSRHWIVFLVNFAIHFVFCALLTIGIPNWGSAGLWQMLALFAKGLNALGVMALFATILWALVVVVSLVYLKITYSIWKAGGKPQQLQQDAAAVAVSHALTTQMGGRRQQDDNEDAFA